MNIKRAIVTAALSVSLFLTAGSAFAFSDVDNSHWAYNDITKLADNGYINGYEDNTFMPSNLITRAEFVTIINKVKDASEMGGNTFSDVNSDKWYAKEIDKAVTAGFINGYEDGSVKPEKTITRAEAAVVCFKAWGLEEEGSIEDFADSTDIAEWAEKAVASLVEKGILSGYEDSTFKPNNPITRAEVAKIVSRLIDMQEAAEATGTPEATPEATSIPEATSTPEATTKPSSSSGGSSGGGGGGGSSSSSSSSSAPTKTQQAALEDVLSGSIDKDNLSTVIKYSDNSVTVNSNFIELYDDVINEMINSLSNTYDSYDLSKKTDAKKFANDVSAVITAVNQAIKDVKAVVKDKDSTSKSELLKKVRAWQDIIDDKATKANSAAIKNKLLDFCENLYIKMSDKMDLLIGKDLSDEDVLAIYNGEYQY